MSSNTPTFEPVELPSRYAKAYVMILTTAVAAISAALAGGLSLDEVVSIGVLVLSTVGVYLVPLGSAGVQRYSKLIIAVLGTAGQAAVPLLMNGGTVDTSGWLLIILAALGAVSVGITPNSPPADPYSKGGLVVNVSGSPERVVRRGLGGGK